eukprot:1191607-Pyramimonas_sp.AAC.1
MSGILQCLAHGTRSTLRFLADLGSRLGSNHPSTAEMLMSVSLYLSPALECAWSTCPFLSPCSS